MDCHVFRRLCDSLCGILPGCRMEKISSPSADVLQFTLYGGGRKRHLLLRFGRSDNFLFFSPSRISTGSAPTAAVMRLRKHLSGRRILGTAVRWPERQLYLHFDPDTPLWLKLDLRTGAELLFEMPPSEEVCLWPSPDDLSDHSENWRQFPVLTPALRKTLQYLPSEERMALLADLEYGSEDLFLYENAAGDR